MVVIAVGQLKKKKRTIWYVCNFLYVGIVSQNAHPPGFGGVARSWLALHKAFPWEKNLSLFFSKTSCSYLV